jgi:hypothetical protein
MKVAVVLPALFASLALAWLACSVPDLNPVGKTCTDTCPGGLPCIGHVCGGSAADGASSPDGGSRDDAPTGDASCTSASNDFCVALPMFTGVQTVDGKNDEFCGVPTFRFNPANEQLTWGSPDPRLSFEATVQAAWSGGQQGALHIFMHVPRWPVVPQPYGVIYQGDAVEVLVAGSSANLTGDVEGDPGTMHVIAAPPALDAGGGGSALTFAVNANGSGGGAPLPASAGFAARLDPGVGYDIELQIPWSTLGPPYPTSGSTIGLDIGIDVMLPNDDGGLDWHQAFHKVLALVGTEMPNGACLSPTDPHPACDDRTWCRPALGDP